MRPGKQQPRNARRTPGSPGGPAQAIPIVGRLPVAPLLTGPDMAKRAGPNDRLIQSLAELARATLQLAGVNRQLIAAAERQVTAELRQASAPRMPGRAASGPKDPKPQAGAFSNLASAGGLAVLGVLKMFAAATLAAIGPLAVFREALRAPTSGMSPFMKSLQLMGAVLGSVLMPGFVLLTGFVYMLAMAISEGVVPALMELWAEKFPKLVRVVDVLVKKFEQLDGGLSKFGASTDLLTATPWLDFFGDDKKGQRRADMMGGILFDPRVQAALPGGGKDGKGGGIKLPKLNMKDMLDGMQMAITSMKQENLGPASYTSGREYAKQAQLAAINRDPFERKILEQFMKVIELVEKMVQKTGPQLGY